MTAHLPFIASTQTIFLIFLGELAALHLVFLAVPAWRLAKRGLAFVQYTVLLLALSGLLGAVSNARHLIARNMYEFGQPHLKFLFTTMRNRLEDYSSPGSMACLKFVRSPDSPPPEEFDRTQREYDAACQWLQQAAKVVPKSLPTDDSEIRLDGLPPPPRTHEGQLNQFYTWFRTDLDDYNATARERRDLNVVAHSSDTDEALILWLPISLSLALALQFTKVSSDFWWRK